MVGNRQEYEAMAACEKDLWWYRNLHLRVLNAIRKSFGNKTDLNIFDAGCGTGGLMSFLMGHGYKNMRGLDISDDAIYFCNKRGLKVEQESILNISSLVEDESLDVLISNDNLYFFDNQRSVLQSYAKTLKQEGICILNLPSLKCFSGTHDKAVGIEKRFDLNSFKLLVEMTGFKIHSSFYWPFFLSPVILSTRLVQRMSSSSNQVVSDVKMPSKGINQILFSLTKLELALPFKGFFGSSLFVVLRKSN